MISLPEAPEAIDKAVRSKLRELEPVSTDAMPVYAWTGLSGGGPRSLSLSAKPVAWRYLVTKSDGEMASVFIPTDQTGRPRGAAQLQSGKIIPETASTLAAARTQIPDADRYEARLLQIPWLHLLAVWLKGETPGRDWVLPTRSSHWPGDGIKVVSEGAFLEHLYVLANHQRQLDRELSKEEEAVPAEAVSTRSAKLLANLSTVELQAQVSRDLANVNRRFGGLERSIAAVKKQVESAAKRTEVKEALRRLDSLAKKASELAASTGSKTSKSKSRAVRQPAAKRRPAVASGRLATRKATTRKTPRKAAPRQSR